MKKCPYCAEEIQDEAIKCRFCRETLNKPKKRMTVERSCPKCHKSYDTSWKVCLGCGTTLEDREVEVNAETELSNRIGETEYTRGDDPYRPARGKNNGLAITAFILGILSVITGLFGLGLLFAIIAVCLGPGGRDSEYRSLASWGMWLGWFVIICYIVVVVFWALFFGGALFLGASGGR